MLSDLGIEWFSTGIYLRPDNPLRALVTRGIFNRSVDQKYLNLFEKSNPGYVPLENAIVRVPSALVQDFDVVWVTHTFPNIEHSWNSFRGKPVIWRTYNQQEPSWEAKAGNYVKKGLKIVRMGHTESRRPTFAGQDEVIRAWVDSSIFCDWSGSSPTILTFHNRFDARLSSAMNGCTRAYLDLRRSMPDHQFELYGFGNENSPVSLGTLDFDQQVQMYKLKSIYLSLNSESAAYTNSFMEALMTGIPVVTFGSTVSDSRSSPELRGSYEVPDLVKNGKEAIVSDDLVELGYYIKELMSNSQLRESIGHSGRQRALQLFNKIDISNQWWDFLKEL